MTRKHKTREELIREMRILRKKQKRTQEQLDTIQTNIENVTDALTVIVNTTRALKRKMNPLRILTSILQSDDEG